LPDPYFLAWDRSGLQKPHGAELRAWIVSIANRQEVQYSALRQPSPV